MGYAPVLFFAGDGITPVDLNAAGTPAFIYDLPPEPAAPNLARIFYQVAQGTGGAQPPYQTIAGTRAAAVASLVAGDPAAFLPVDFSRNAPAPAPLVTVNAGAVPASVYALAAGDLAPGVVAACRLVYVGGAYIDVQGTLAAVSAALAAASGPGGGGIVGPSNVAFVDTNGNDATGLVGDAARPFKTIGAATTALGAVPGPLAYAQVRIGPGLFIGDVPPIPATLRRLSIIGSGPQLTQVAPATPGATLFDLGVNVARDDFQAFGFTASVGGGGKLLTYDGGAQLSTGNAFQNGACAPGFVGVAGDVEVKRLGTFATFFGCELFGIVRVETCIQWLAFDCFVGPVELTQDYDDPALAPLLPLDLKMTAVRVLGNGVKLQKQARIEGQGCNFDGTIEPGGVGLTVSVAQPGSLGGCTLRDSIVRKVDFGSAPVKQLPDTAAGAFQVEFPETLIREDFIARVQAPAANFQNANLAGATFQQVTPIIGDGIHADMRDAVTQSSDGFAVSTPDATGDVIPPPFATGPVPVAANPQTIPFGFRMLSTAYGVALDADDATTLPLATTTKTQTDCQATVAVVAGNLRALVTWVG